MLKIDKRRRQAFALGAFNSFRVVKEADYQAGLTMPHEDESADWPAICKGVFQSREETCPA
jgi:hypothetical protein